MSFIEAKNLSKTYGSGDSRQLALNDVSFTIEEGEFVVILGPSGAGKTTLLNMLGGMDTLTGGSIVVNGDELAGLNDNQLTDYRARQVGFVFQFYNLIATLTARENVALCKDIVKNTLDPDEVLEAVGLAVHKSKFPSQLSGGEQQRVAIARALAKNPALILGDEPTGALDASTGASVLQLMQTMSEQRRKTVVIVTHNAAISECADKVIRIKDGRIESITINACKKHADRITW